MSSIPQVDCLVAVGLSSQLILPDDPKYAECTDSYFDNDAKLHPACYFRPQSTSDVVKAVKALSEAEQPFAIRAGGCTNRSGCNNIDNGVTIDLSLLNSVEYDAKSNTAHVGAGATWQPVYEELDKHQRVLGGGRVGTVGVGGYLLGGGLSFYAGRHGFACDNVVAYEVVLGDGSIVTASADEHQDLFRVLKGGGSNFGIVTRFTLNTIPAGPVWGGVSVKPSSGFQTGSNALVDFTSNASSDPDSTMIYVAANQPEFGGEALMALTFNVAGVEKPKAFEKFAAMPELFSKYHTGKAQEILPFSELPRGHYNIWYTLTIKNDPEIVNKASELLFKLGKELQAHVSNGEFSTYVAFQPIPRLYTEQSIAAGGNVLGLDQYQFDSILLQASARVNTEEQARWVRPRVEALVDEVRAFAISKDGHVSWTYLNYASSNQDVLKSYGTENVRRMKEAAAKYDPKGVFQRLCKGGFKISAVED